MADFYTAEGIKSLRKLRQTKPDMFARFVDFDEIVFKDGALSSKMKHLMAIAAGHVTQCPWCIDIHTRKAKEDGATDEEVAEAIFVAMALRAGGSWAHSSIAMNVLEGKE